MFWINVFMTVFLLALFLFIFSTRSKSPSDELGDPPVAADDDDEQ